MNFLFAGLIGVAVVLVFMGLERLMRTDDPAFDARLRRYALREGTDSELGDAGGRGGMGAAMTAQMM